MARASHSSHFRMVKGTRQTALNVRLSASVQEGNTPLAVTFTAVPTGGSGTYILSYTFGDGSSRRTSSSCRKS